MVGGRDLKSKYIKCKRRDGDVQRGGGRTLSREGGRWHPALFAYTPMHDQWRREPGRAPGQHNSWAPGADTGFPAKGGGKTFTSTPPPLGHCPRDVIRPPKN